MSTVSSTLCVCSGMPVPGPNTVMPVVTLFSWAFHLPTRGMVLTPEPRSNASIRSGCSTIGASLVSMACMLRAGAVCTQHVGEQQSVAVLVRRDAFVAQQRDRPVLALQLTQLIEH